MNKKADIKTIIIMVALVFALALGSILFAKIFIDVTDELKDVEMFSNNTIETIDRVQDKTIPLLDFFVFMVLIAFFIGLIVSSIYINVHPAIMVVFIIVLVVAILLAGLFTNIFAEVTAEDELTATAGEFALTGLILGTNFPLIVLVIGVVVIVILYGKSRKVGEV